MSRFHAEFWKDSTYHVDEIANEKDIKAYIEQNQDGDFSQILKYDNRWMTFYHLTEMRKSILNWYEFKDNAELLEIGGGMGALTGLFCERCTHVTTVESSKVKAEAIYTRYHDKKNLDIYAGSINDINFGKKFDYITVIGALEHEENNLSSKNSSAELLKKLAGLLKPDGKLLLAIENRFGIKYWCGNKEEHSGIPFEGINGYPNGQKVRSFGKKELEKILISSSLSQYKFYYPMPDYKLPQIIYSEKYLPQNSLQARMIPYYLDNTTLLASEMDLYDDLIENNVFEFFSNSFLVEAGFNDNFCSVIYAAVTTDRPPADRFCTTIHENEIVKKKPLDEEGYASIQKIYDNVMELQTRGIRIVPHKIENNTLIMPRMECESLEGYLKTIIRQDKDRFVELFDKFYECILKSSNLANAELNFFFDSNNPELDFGPILEKAYIDLIPNNCFFYNHDFVFFDQEFSRPNFPAKFVMFRALKYTYSFIPFANDIIPLERMKRKYKLEVIWDIFEKEDNKFVSENRNYSLYFQFLRWSYLDKTVLSKNVRQLMRSDAADSLIKKGYRKIAIYGYGNNGIQLYQNLKNSGVEIVYAIDQNADNIVNARYTEIPVLNLDDKFDYVDAIVVTVTSAFNSIKTILKEKTRCPIISLEEIVMDGLS